MLKSPAADLLDCHVDLIVVLEVELFGGLGFEDAVPVEHEPDIGHGQPIPLAVRLHQLLELRSPLNFKMNFLIVLGLDLQVYVVRIFTLAHVSNCLFN
jgi:hypothetical protein